MRLLPPMGPETAPERGLFNPYERKRMIMLSVLVVISSHRLGGEVGGD